MYTRPDRATLSGSSSGSPRTRLVRRRQHRWPSRPGYNFGETAELFDHPYEVKPAALRARAPTRTSPATRRWPGASSPPASWPSCPVFLGSYPITPASDILHELSKHKNFGVRTLQAEDEIAGRRRRHRRGVRRPPRRHHHERPRPRPQGRGHRAWPSASSCRWSSSTSSAAGRRPACRPRPSRPTCCWPCTAATASRRCRSWPPSTPADCFDAAIEAARIALKYRTPVILLSDGYLANGAEPWLLPDVDDAARHQPCPSPTEPTTPTPTARRVLALPARPRHPRPTVGHPRHARPEHRIGGLEKEDGTGNISYDPANHEHMVHLRASKIAGIAKDIPGVEVDDPDGADLLVARLGLHLRRHRRRRPAGSGHAGRKVAHAHLMHLNPFPTNLGEVLRRYPQGARAGDEPGPAVAAPPGRVPGRRQERHQDRRACRSRRPRSRPRSSPSSEAACMTDTDGPRHHQEGLGQRPGGPLVPRLRRLLDPHRRPDAHARARRAPRRTPCSCPASAAPAASRTT